MSAIRIGVVGLGKIARDQHLPASASDARFRLAATVAPRSVGVEGTPHFDSLAAPIAADLRLRDSAGAVIPMDLDWHQTGPQTWDIVVETNAGTCRLSRGGATLMLPEGEATGEDSEYPNLYAHFAGLVRDGRRDVDVRPLQLVADAFLLARRDTVEAFYD